MALFHARIRIVAERRTRDREAAQEIAQDVLVDALSEVRAGRLRDGDKLTAFVYGIARNHINSHLRTAGRKPEARALEEADSVIDPGDAIERREQESMARDAMKALSATDRKILLLTLADGLKPGEIARRLGLSDEVVRARKSRALRKLMDRIKSRSRT